jgi:predicted transcriptional regulator
MKLKEEQKEVIKAVSAKMAEKLVDDVKATEVKSMKRPLVIFLLVVAVVGILRDPMSLIVGVIAALLVALVMSTSAEDLSKLTASFAKKEGDKKTEADVKDEVKKETETK